MAWTESLIEELRTRWNNGESCSEIGAAMHISRNAVIGKVHRMGLHTDVYATGKRKRPLSGANSRQFARGVKKRKFRLNPYGTAKLTVTPVVVKDYAEPPAKHNCSLIELKSDSCRFPIGDPQKPDFRFCGAINMGYPMSYCGFHARLAYQTPAQRAAEKREWRATHGPKV